VDDASELLPGAHFGSTGGIFGSGRHGEFVVFVGLKEADLEVS